MTEKEEIKINVENFQDPKNKNLIWPKMICYARKAFNSFMPNKDKEGHSIPSICVELVTPNYDEVILWINGKILTEKYPARMFASEKDLEICIYNAKVNRSEKNKLNHLTLRTESDISFIKVTSDFDPTMIEPTKEEEITEKKKEFEEMKEEKKNDKSMIEYDHEQKSYKLNINNVFDFFPQLKEKFTIPQVAVAIEQCNRLGLDPLAKEINLIPRQDKISTEIPYLTYVRIGKSHPNYSHYKAGIIYVEKDKEIVVEGTRDKGFQVVGGWCRIFLKDGTETFVDIDFDKYKPIAKWSLWEKMPGVMVRKSAISFLFRETFPDFFIGTMGQEEMEQAN